MTSTGRWRSLEEAVKIDTAFAAAWRKLGIAYANADMSRERQDSAFAHAYRFRERLTERERLDATADYFAAGPGRDRAPPHPHRRGAPPAVPERGRCLQQPWRSTREPPTSSRVPRRCSVVTSSWIPRLRSRTEPRPALLNVGKVDEAEVR